MKLLGLIGTLLWGVGLGLAPQQAAAAAKYDGSAPLLCVPVAVNECGAEGECRRATPESVNFPPVFKVDVKGMAVRSAETGRESRIKNVEHANGKLVLQGIDPTHGWILMIHEDTGKLSGTVTGHEEGFVLFGVCALP